MPTPDLVIEVRTQEGLPQITFLSSFRPLTVAVIHHEGKQIDVIGVRAGVRSTLWPVMVEGADKGEADGTDRDTEASE